MPWTVTQLVTQVQKRTENRANNLFDMNMEFFLALDEFCGEEHFWWRKKRASVTTQIGAAQYDLSTIATDMVQLGEVVLLNPAGTAVQSELTPITDAGQPQLNSILNATQDLPKQYFVDLETSTQNITLQAPSSVSQKILFTYWAIPMVTNTGLTAIPLVPANLHWGLCYCLERRVYELLYGQEDPRWQMADKRYQEFIQKALKHSHWSARNIQEAVGGAAEADEQGAGG